MIRLLSAALAGATFSAAVCLIMWKIRMRRHAVRPEFRPPDELTEWDRRFMAYHEAGHAVCSRFLPERPPMLRITISPSDEAFGMVRSAQSKNHNETRRSLCSTLAVLLAGHLAEELFLNETTTSGIHDFAAAGQLAADMVCKFGMGKTAGVALPPPDFPVSDWQLRMINADIRQLMLDAEAEAREMLSRHRETVEKLAALLLRENTLDADRIDRFFSDAAG